LKKIIIMLTTLAIILSLTVTPSFAADSGSAAGTVSTASGSLNIRSGPGMGYSVKSSLKSGAAVTLISRTGSWWRVEYASGVYGYAHSAYISPVSGSYAAYVATEGDRLNVRSGAGTGYGITGKLNNGTGIVVLSNSGSWLKILYNGVSTGYVSAAYVKAYGSSYAAVSLSVPIYKQRDSRWSSVKIGSSGGTIGSIGCTTCCLAMTESYRTGSTLTPSAMASRLSYTSGGALYWPDNYTVTTNSTNYLATIYDLLSAGKPAIISGKNSGGGTHWVVVTGFTGGALSPSNFTINDPGTSATTLAGLWQNYPTFYKLAYYA
jgi:uncharacterized protein YgiM (DUF1202 family)